MHFRSIISVMTACTARWALARIPFDRVASEHCVPKMASSQQNPRSILKRPKETSMPVVCANDVPPVRKTEQLVEILEEVRLLKENLEKIPQDLVEFEWQSPEGGALCIGSALKKLSDIGELYMKRFYEHRVLIERLRVKLESMSSAGAILSLLVEEMNRNQSAFSKELENDLSMHVCSSPNHGGDREGSLRQQLAPVISNEIPWQRNDHSELIQKLTSFTRDGFKTLPVDVWEQLKAMEVLVASVKENFEEDRRRYLAAKETMGAQEKNLRFVLHSTKAGVELMREKQMKRTQEAVQEFLDKNNELFDAMALLQSLEAEFKDLNRSIEGLVLPRADKCDSEYVLDHIECVSTLLQNAKLPDHHLRQFCIEINRIRDCIKLAPTPNTQGVEHENTQTELTGAKFAEAIRSHAANLAKRMKPKKRDDAGVSAGEDSSQSTKSKKRDNAIISEGEGNSQSKKSRNK